MEKMIIPGILIAIFIITAGITLDTYLVSKYELECIKSGGRIEQMVGRYGKTVCTK